MFLFLFTGQEEKEAQVYDFVTGACEKNRNKKKIRNRWGSGFFPFFEKRNKQKQTEPSTNNEPFFSFFLYFFKLLLPISVREARPRGCEKQEKWKMKGGKETEGRHKHNSLVANSDYVDDDPVYFGRFYSVFVIDYYSSIIPEILFFVPWSCSCSKFAPYPFFCHFFIHFGSSLFFPIFSAAAAPIQFALFSYIFWKIQLFSNPSRSCQARYLLKC